MISKQKVALPWQGGDNSAVKSKNPSALSRASQCIIGEGIKAWSSPQCMTGLTLRRRSSSVKLISNEAKGYDP